MQTKQQIAKKTIFTKCWCKANIQEAGLNYEMVQPSLWDVEGTQMEAEREADLESGPCVD